MTGEISGPGARRGTPLALALDGKVVAVGWSAMLAHNPHVYFSFFAPPSPFHDGANAAEVFAVRGMTLERVL